MGSPVSPIVANLYMEHFEERAIREAPHPPDIWLRYVDDTFTVLQENEVEHFTHHLNSMDENIKLSFFNGSETGFSHFELISVSRFQLILFNKTL